jgi:excisionase family DNA binding protein
MDTATKMEPPKDKRSLAKLGRLAGLALPPRRQPCLVAVAGEEIPLPSQLLDLIVKVAGDLQAGRSVFVVSGDQALTPQAAADFLGMSRQFLARLLETGALPFHKVGTHRRLLFKDVQRFADRRAQQRRATLEKLRDRLHADGVDT